MQAAWPDHDVTSNFPPGPQKDAEHGCKNTYIGYRESTEIHVGTGIHVNDLQLLRHTMPLPIFASVATVALLSHLEEQANNEA